MSEQRYYWLKLKRDFFKRHDIRVVEEMPNGKDYILFYMKLLVESIDHEGALRFSETIPYNSQMLSIVTNTNPDVVEKAIQIFKELKMIEVLDDGTIYMAEVARMIDSAIDTPAARKMRRYRERKKAEEQRLITGKVTNCYGDGNEALRDIDIEKEKEIDTDSRKKNIKESSNENTASTDELIDFIKERGGTI